MKAQGGFFHNITFYTMMAFGKQGDTSALTDTKNGLFHRSNTTVDALNKCKGEVENFQKHMIYYLFKIFPGLFISPIRNVSLNCGFEYFIKVFNNQSSKRRRQN